MNLSPVTSLQIEVFFMDIQFFSLSAKMVQLLREEVNFTIDYLDNVAFPKIENLYKENPDDKDAISVYEMACRDGMLMLSIFNNL